MRTLAVLAVLGLSVGCADDAKRATAPPAAEPAAAEPAPTPVEPEAPAAEPEAPAAEPAADDDCVTACVARNQMRAVAPEQIEADCKAECTE